MRIAVLDREHAGAVGLLKGTDERVVHTGVVRPVGTGSAGVHAVLQIGFYPRAVAGASAEPAAGSPVDRIHGRVAIVFVVVLTAAKVEAAPLVHQIRRGHHVNPLALGASRHAPGVVDAVADALGDLDPIEMVTGDGHWQVKGTCSFVRAVGARTIPVASPGDHQVVVVGGLVVKPRDDTRGARAEREFPSHIGIPTRRQGADIVVRMIGCTLHLVQRIPVVRREKRAYGAISGDARVTIGRQNVAGLRSGCPDRCGGDAK